MIKIKKLHWTNENGIITAIISGLKWNYYILPVESGFELTLLDDNLNYNAKNYKICATLEEAKHAAEEHYKNTISKLINVITHN